jgi:hypothetical protein
MRAWHKPRHVNVPRASGEHLGFLAIHNHSLRSHVIVTKLHILFREAWS